MSNLVVLYGPPAAGKTTIGRDLAALTGFRFFFNHLTVPAAKAIFPEAHQPYPDERYTQLLHKLRLDCLNVAAEAGFDTIFTIAYSGARDDMFMQEIVDTFISRGGQVQFVELHAPTNVLLNRVANKDRVELKLHKVTNPTHLQEILDGHNMFESVKFDNILRIDTSSQSPAESARIIAAVVCKDIGK